ncbi:uncharacterized protein MJAP1_001321 [Malassezia japonica]|uniref:Eukaryotic translation initiation factor 3 subunit K n=1 Tax=Malassezia japonica TaxID=223818 RepID=A0AAF0JA61_9BASI|nr:uncharacterized protein MJAP1_001321 [Malassezia japonica]WFD38369.1 hypothetical protein MJAP1_001321 [Malassezia japonica]
MASTSDTATAHTWVHPECRPENIEKLISDVDRYNPQNRTVLVEYLNAQLKNGTYDALPNLAILKLFQLNPSEFDLDVAVNILVKALTAAPFPDFSLCISLLGEAPVKTLSSNDAALSTGAAGIITEPIIVHLATLSTFLFETKFRDFWALYNSGDFADVRKYTANAAGFEEDVRKVVLNSVKGTFRTISEARIGGYLNLQGADLAKFINEQPGWELSNGTVTVPANIDNEVKPTVTREEISLENLSKLLAQA